MIRNFDLIESILKGFKLSFNIKYPLTFCKTIQTILKTYSLNLNDKKNKI